MQRIGRTTSLLTLGLCTSLPASYSTNTTITTTSTTMGFEPADHHHHHHHHHQTSAENVISASELDNFHRLIDVCALCGNPEGTPQAFCVHSPKTSRRRQSGTRKMARSLRRMGDELYLRRMPLHNLVTIFLLQMVPGAWGRRVLSRWLTPTADTAAETKEDRRSEDEEATGAERNSVPTCLF